MPSAVPKRSDEQERRRRHQRLRIGEVDLAAAGPRIPQRKLVVPDARERRPGLDPGLETAASRTTTRTVRVLEASAPRRRRKRAPATGAAARRCSRAARSRPSLVSARALSSQSTTLRLEPYAVEAVDLLHPRRRRDVDLGEHAADDVDADEVEPVGAQLRRDRGADLAVARVELATCAARPPTCRFERVSSLARHAQDGADRLAVEQAGCACRRRAPRAGRPAPSPAA